MNVQHHQLKNLMVREKLFLKELYEGNDLEKKRKTLNFASDQKEYSRLCNYNNKGYKVNTIVGKSRLVNS